MYHYFVVLNYALWLVRMNYAASWVGALPMFMIVAGLVSAYVYDSWRARIAGYVLSIICVGSELLTKSSAKLDNMANSTEIILFACSLLLALMVQIYDLREYNPIICD